METHRRVFVTLSSGLTQNLEASTMKRLKTELSLGDEGSLKSLQQLGDAQQLIVGAEGRFHSEVE